MTYQEIFTKVRNHLLAQNKKSLIPPHQELTSGCAYRGIGNTACAIGCLIPDSLYTIELEGRSVGSTDVSKVLAQVIGLEWDTPEMWEYIRFLRKLQLVHDGAIDPSEWPGALADVAFQENLIS